MKKFLSVICLSILVWGCAKKMTPAKSETPSSGVYSIPGDNGTSATASATPIESTGTYGSKIAPVGKTADETAAIAGQAIYNVKCNKCHGLKVTSDFTSDHWASILVVMAPRAGLTDTEKENVYAYVKANAKK